MKTPLMFVHGNWGDKASWALVARRFESLGHPVVCLRMPERGTQAVGEKSFTDYVKVIVEEAAQMRDQYGQWPVIFGHSLGATLALKAAEAGYAAGLVLAAPSPPTNLSAPLSLSMIRLFLPWLIRGLARGGLAYPYRPSLFAVSPLFAGWPREAIAQAHASMHADSGRILLEFLRRSPATQIDPKLITCPVLCVAGTKDPVSTPKSVLALAAWCRGNYVKVEGSHFLTMENEAIESLVISASHLIENVEAGARAPAHLSLVTPGAA